MTDETDNPNKKRLHRRSFMASVLGGVAVAGGASALIAGSARAQQRPTGRSDSDSGASADRAGYGRTGATDSDSNDRAGYGVGGGGGGRSGLSDSDPVDPAGNGRGSGGRNTGISDSDSGSNADAAGQGRGPARG